MLTKRETPIRYNSDIIEYHGRYLPHWQVDNGIYFVTFRLADSLPGRARFRAKSAFESELSDLLERGADDSELTSFKLRHFLCRIEPVLDRGLGNCFLERPTVAQIVANALEYFDGARYELFAWTIMGNHVHILFRLFAGDRLQKVVHSWKSYTAQKANGLLDRRGKPFWQPDYFDRLVRTVEEFDRTRKYVWYNPEAAGIEDWEWREYYPGRAGVIPAAA